MRAIVNCEVEGLVEKYFTSIYTFTIGCYQSNLPNKEQTITELMAFMNQVWQRFMFETVQLKSELQAQIEEYITQVITV